MSLSPITPRRISGSHVDVTKCFEWKISPWPVPVASISTALAEPRAASYSGCPEKPGQLQGTSASPLLSREDIGMCQWKIAGNVSCVSGSWRICATLCSYCLPLTHSSFLSTPKMCPVCKWKPCLLPEAGVPGRYLPERKLPLRTAVGAKFDYSVARTKAWGSAEDLDPQRRSLCIPRQATSSTFRRIPSRRIRSL